MCLTIDWELCEKQRQEWLIHNEFEKESLEDKEKKLGFLTRILGLNAKLYDKVTVDLLYAHPFKSYALTFDNVLNFIILFFFVFFFVFFLILIYCFCLRQNCVCVTICNKKIIKMIGIYFRVQSNIPVILLSFFVFVIILFFVIIL